MTNSLSLKLIWLLPLLISLKLGVAGHYKIEEIPNWKTDFGKNVSDPDHYLTIDRINELSELCQDIEDESGVEIAIVLIEYLNEEDILSAATELGELWGVGKNDDGVVILVAIEDREMAISVGYQLENVLTDLITQEIQEQDIIPYFKEDYGLGLFHGLKSIESIVVDHHVPNHISRKVGAEFREFLLVWILIFLTVLRYLASLFVKQMKRKKQIIALVVATLVGLLAYLISLNSGNSNLQSLTWTVLLIYCILLLALRTTEVFSWVVTYIVIQRMNLVFFIGSFLMLFNFQKNADGVVPPELLEFPYALMIVGIVFMVFMIAQILVTLNKLKKFPVGEDLYDTYWKWSGYKNRMSYTDTFPFPKGLLRRLIDKKMQWFRYAPRHHERSGMPMQMVENKRSYLNKAQLIEEKYDVCKYDVWKSDLDEILIYKYELRHVAKMAKCPDCGYVTYRRKKNVLERPTYEKSGRVESHSECLNCGKLSEKEISTLPKLVKRVQREDDDSSFTISFGSSNSSRRSSSRSSRKWGSSFSRSSKTSSRSSSRKRSWGGGRFGGGGSKSKW